VDHIARAVEEDVKNILHTRVALSEKLQRMTEELPRGVRGLKCMVQQAIDGTANASVETMNSTVGKAGYPRWILLGGAAVVALLAKSLTRPKPGV
jgi:hypothetical protein